MKTLIQILSLLILTVTLQSCGGSKGGGSGAPTGSSEANGQQAETFNQEEIALAQGLEGCYQSFNLFAPLEDEKLDFIAIGFIGHECLKIKSVTKLKTILSGYKMHRLANQSNWKELARKTLKTE